MADGRGQVALRVSDFVAWNSNPRNVCKYISGNKTVWQPQVINLAGANQFPSAPSFFTMNG